MSAISIEIPLEPFDSGLDYVAQPESTRILLYDFSLPAPGPREAAGRTFDLSRIEQGGSVCIGGRHNPVDIISMTLHHIASDRFEAALEVLIDFEFEGVGSNETVPIVAELVFKNDEPQP